MAFKRVEFNKFKPHMLMIFSQMAYTFLYFITEASFNHGFNPHVYVTYRHIVGGVVTFPFAYFLERKLRPNITFALFMEIFVLSLIGVSLTLNMYYASLRFTSPTFLSSIVNTISSLTFLMAVILRLEALDLKNPRGIAKVMGSVVSLAGVTIMTLYKGPVIEHLWNPLVRLEGNSVFHEDWLKGSILTVSSCLTWSMWYIMQVKYAISQYIWKDPVFSYNGNVLEASQTYTLERYPAQLSLTAWMSFMGAAQSAVFTAMIVPRPDAWKLRSNVDLWSTVYGGVAVSGLVVFAQLWCTERKGPVFVTMFNPLSTVLVAVLAYFVLGEKLYLGSVVGAVVVIMGLYLLLWGKEHDRIQRRLNGQLNESEFRQDQVSEVIPNSEL